MGSQDTGYSKVFQFKSLEAGHDWLPKFIVMGDLGWQNQESLPYLEEEAREIGAISAIFHIGKFFESVYFILN